MAQRAGEPVKQIGYRAIAFLGALTPEDVQALPPAVRRQFADLCAYWAKRAEPRQSPKSGVLGDLVRGARAD